MSLTAAVFLGWVAGKSTCSNCPSGHVSQPGNLKAYMNQCMPDASEWLASAIRLYLSSECCRLVESSFLLFCNIHVTRLLYSALDLRGRVPSLMNEHNVG